eukprot:m.105340 g.105340  ORF g.105340 m.105340 type:complete len:744 (-) comp18935_c0_seq4:41-2272(-)
MATMVTTRGKNIAWSKKPSRPAMPCCTPTSPCKPSRSRRLAAALWTTSAPSLTTSWQSLLLFSKRESRTRSARCATRVALSSARWWSGRGEHSPKTSRTMANISCWPDTRCDLTTVRGGKDADNAEVHLEAGDAFDVKYLGDFDARTALQLDLVFDFGYVGDVLCELSACEMLGGCATALFKAVAMPQSRTAVPYNQVPELKSFQEDNVLVPMNEQQRNIIAGLRHNIELIQGPPGTGKSTTIFHIIKCSLPKNSVALACCVQNKAVDAIADKLAGKIPFFVHGNEERLGLVSKQWTIEAQVERHPHVQHFAQIYDNIKEFCLSLRVEIAKKEELMEANGRLRRRRAQALAKFPHDGEKREAFLQNDPWKQLWCGYLRNKYRYAYALSRFLLRWESVARPCLERVVNSVAANIISQASAVLCTVASTSTLLRGSAVIGRQKDKKKARFDAVGVDLVPVLRKITAAILDEAGTSPESKIPVLLMLPLLNRIIGIGDQKQLQPFTHIQESAACFAFQKTGRCSRGGCRFSHQSGPVLQGFFQRVEKALPQGTVPCLQQQYRMHPAICRLVANCFYDGILMTPQFVAEKRTKADLFGLYLVDVAGTESTPERSKSQRNLNEVEAVLRVYEKLNLSYQSVMIITYYKGQCHLLKSKFQQAGYEEDQLLRICTVDQSQGSEADIVILSTVRANARADIGFLKNPNRLNVSISRARERLIVVGNKRTLQQCNDRNWKAVVAACQPMQLK